LDDTQLYQIFAFPINHYGIERNYRSGSRRGDFNWKPSNNPDKSLTPSFAEGSGNILMAPNDQYLCIVPKQTVGGGERVHLPFEGDGTLSIILSKAFLLAEDAKFFDPMITSQLGNK
jgi:hypothetical protein